MRSRIALLFLLAMTSLPTYADVFYSRFTEADCSFLNAEQEPLEQLLAEPFENAFESYLKMYCLERSIDGHHDRRQVFLTMYLRTTEAVVHEIEQESFEDNVWADAYLTVFANLYRSAFYLYEKGETKGVPTAWRLAFEAAKDPSSLITQHLLLGVNAHVNHDLGLALATFDLDVARESKYRDHNRINGILEAIVDEQFALVAEKYASGLGELPPSLDKVLKGLFFVNLRIGREAAWKKALILQNTPNPLLNQSLRAGIDAEAGFLAHVGLSPKLHPQLLEALRRIEKSSLDF